MRPARCLLLLFVILSAGESIAQNYDADSVLYTPIPKEKPSRKPLPIFRDTSTVRSGVLYFFNVNMGPLPDCSDCGTNALFLSASTIHGITIGKKLRVAAGMGVDSYYAWQVVPFFGNVSYDLVGTKNAHALFIQAQYGVSAASRGDREEDWALVDTDGGQYMSAQLGYRLKYHDINFAILAGMKRQYLYSYYEYPGNPYFEDGIWKTGTTNTRNVKTQLDRFMLMLSIGWR